MFPFSHSHGNMPVRRACLKIISSGLQGSRKSFPGKNAPRKNAPQKIAPTENYTPHPHPHDEMKFFVIFLSLIFYFHSVYFFIMNNNFFVLYFSIIFFPMRIFLIFSYGITYMGDQQCWATLPDY